VPLVVIVNVRVDTSWQGEVNSELLAGGPGLARGDARRLVRRERRQRNLLADGTHTTPLGAKLFAALIARAIHDPHLGGVTH
jgi:lysophospholipase L1-like esterase